eukprot:1201282-Amphidinium_carterae.1
MEPPLAALLASMPGGAVIATVLTDIGLVSVDALVVIGGRDGEEFAQRVVQLSKELDPHNVLRDYSH